LSIAEAIEESERPEEVNIIMRECIASCAPLQPQSDILLKDLKTEELRSRDFAVAKWKLDFEKPDKHALFRPAGIKGANSMTSGLTSAVITLVRRAVDAFGKSTTPMLDEFLPIEKYVRILLSPHPVAVANYRWPTRNQSFTLLRFHFDDLHSVADFFNTGSPGEIT